MVMILNRNNKKRDHLICPTKWRISLALAQSHQLKLDPQRREKERAVIARIRTPSKLQFIILLPNSPI